VLLSAEDVPDHKKNLGIQGIVKKDFSSHFMMKTILAVLKQKQPVQPVEPPSETAKASILIVDDNPEIRDVFWGFLTKKGYKATSVSSGEEALMHIKTEREKPKIVLLDIRMPGMDGIMVMKKIRELDESIKVVMVTSAQEEYIMKEAMNAGASDYLVKPFDLENLDALISSLLIA